MNILGKSIIVLSLTLALGLTSAVARDSFSIDLGIGGGNGFIGLHGGDHDNYRHHHREYRRYYNDDSDDYGDNVRYYPDRWCEVRWPYGEVCHYY